MSSGLLGRMSDITRAMGHRAYSAVDRALASQEEQEADMIREITSDDSAAAPEALVNIGHIEIRPASAHDADVIDAIIED